MPGTYIPADYLPVLIMFIVASCFGLVMLTVGTIFRLRRPYPEKLLPYESGMAPVGEPRQRFDVKFYIIAMLFVVFDVEAVFLYPWAVVYGKLGLYAVVEMFLFIAILLVGYVYAWKRGAFEWE
ncbi:MAG: NADH-quinone oxidoreductase subunit A [Nitrospirae bacterium]|nr:NADH-quinone oxidoreductase subunit A [Nitrospirota bacterium]